MRFGFREEAGKDNLAWTAKAHLYAPEGAFSLDPEQTLSPFRIVSIQHSKPQGLRFERLEETADPSRGENAKQWKKLGDFKFGTEENRIPPNE